MHPALTLEEIKTRIGDFLSTADILACICVSQAWHASFKPHLFTSLTFHPNRPMPPTTTGRPVDYEHRIRHLHFADYYPPNILTLQGLHLTHLTCEGIIPSSQTTVSRFLLSNRKELATVVIHCTPPKELPRREGVDQAQHEQERMELYTHLIQTPQEALPEHLAQITQHHPALMTAFANPNAWRQPLEGLWSVLSGCFQLRRLELKGLHIQDEDSLKTFWTLCQSLESLQLENTTLPEIPSGGNAQAPPFFWLDGSLLAPEGSAEYWDQLLQRTVPDEFPRMRHLGLHRLHQWSDQWQGQLFARCPNLGSVDLSCHMDLFSVAVAKRTWPQLKSITAREVVSHEQHWILILNSTVAPLSKLIVPLATIGAAGFEILRRRHFGTLRELNLSRCRMILSEMVLTVLEECLVLERFSASRVQALDMVSRQTPWACRKTLRHLSIYIAVDHLGHSRRSSLQASLGDHPNKLKSNGKEVHELRLKQHEKAFQLLGSLTKLETLDLNPPKNETARADLGSGLELQVKMGLVAMSDLCRLREITLPGLQKMEWLEVLWMTEHWKSLRRIKGKVNTETELVEQLEQILDACGVSVLQ